MGSYPFHKSRGPVRFVRIVFVWFDLKDCCSQILVAIHAASLNPIDFKLRAGKLKMLLPYSFPLVLGHDLSGTQARLLAAQVN